MRGLKLLGYLSKVLKIMACSTRCSAITILITAILIYLVQLKVTTFLSIKPSLIHTPLFEEFLQKTRRDTSSRLTPSVQNKQFLVIGGNGFTGGYLVEDLLQRGAAHVRILSRRGRPAELSNICKSAAENGRLAWIRGDLTLKKDVAIAVDGMDVVFLLAAHYGSPTFSRYGDWSAGKTRSVNVDGTRNVVEACQLSNRTKLLVYTSSSDVVFNRVDSVNRTEATTDSPPDATCHYLRTKGEGEKALLAASGPTLTTVALRPSGIYGPGENFFMPKVVAPGYLLRSVGIGAFFFFDENHISDMIFVYNLILAELSVVASFDAGVVNVGGEAFFITDDQAVNLAAWEAWRPVFDRLNVPLRRWLRIPPAALRWVATWSEWLLWQLRERGVCDVAPLLTEHESWRATTTMHHDITKAKKMLNYRPIVNTTEGMEWLGEEMSRRYAHF